MVIALTIGIMFLIFGTIGYMQEEWPSTILDDIDPQMYIVIGVIVLINLMIHIFIEQFPL